MPYVHIQFDFFFFGKTFVPKSIFAVNPKSECHLDQYSKHFLFDSLNMTGKPRHFKTSSYVCKIYSQTRMVSIPNSSKLWTSFILHWDFVVDAITTVLHSKTNINNTRVTPYLIRSEGTWRLGQKIFIIIFQSVFHEHKGTFAFQNTQCQNPKIISCERPSITPFQRHNRRFCVTLSLFPQRFFNFWKQRKLLGARYGLDSGI